MKPSLNVLRPDGLVAGELDGGPLRGLICQPRVAALLAVVLGTEEDAYLPALGHPALRKAPDELVVELQPGVGRLPLVRLDPLGDPAQFAARAWPLLENDSAAAAQPFERISL